MPGGLYGGSNPPPWDDMGISETHKQVDSQLSMVEGPDGEMYPDGWALYEHGTAGVLFGVVAAYRPNGWSFGSFKGPFDSVEDGVDTLESFYTTRKAGIQGGTFEGFEKETKT